MAKKVARSTGKAAKAASRKPVKKSAAGKQTARPRGASLLGIVAGFTVNDAAASIKWYCDVLGFKVLERWDHEGRFLGAQIGSGNVVFNISQDDFKLGRDRVKGQGTRIYVSMGPDVDGYANAIKMRGGTLAHEPKTDWGVRAFSIVDPDGFKLTFMSQTAKK